MFGLSEKLLKIIKPVLEKCDKHVLLTCNDVVWSNFNQSGTGSDNFRKLTICEFVESKN